MSEEAGIARRFREWIWPAPDREVLPERVHAAIRTQQDRSERLIGWVQLLVVITFGTLYLISPKTFSEEAAFAPVPWALSIYLGLTVIRVIWSHMGRLPGWTLALSSVFDIGLLMVLIWSFHIQYGQPPSFYLKAPTLLYVFIFIALRALRFEARYVLWTGALAALGWTALVFYVMWAEPGNPMITRNYVTYLTSNSMLIGAELDKIISILLVTLILAVALNRARALLVRSVAEHQAAQQLSRFFDDDVARIISESEEVRAGAGEARQAAIVYLDMRGFSQMAATHSPAAVMQVLADYQHRMVPVITEHGGAIDKFMGDGIMATFGADVPSETYAADALRALEAALAAGEAWGKEAAEAGEEVPPVNGAVAHGRVVFGAVGDESRLEFTVIGEAVNLAAKLEKHNKAEGTKALASAETYALALEQGYEPRGETHALKDRTVEGLEAPVDLVAVA